MVLVLFSAKKAPVRDDFDGGYIRSHPGGLHAVSGDFRDFLQ